MPAPAEISPVGFSSTSISRIFWSFFDPSIILFFISPNMFLALSLAIDCSNFVLLNGSPSSIKSSDLITASSVILLPIILTFSTNSFFPSNILILISIVSPSKISLTECSINCKSLFNIKISNSSNNFFTLNGE